MTIEGLFSLWLIARPGAAAATLEPPPISWSSELKLASLAAIDDALAQPIDDLPDAIMDADNAVRPIKTCVDMLAVSKAKFHLSQDNQLAWEGFVEEALRCFALDTLKGARPAGKSFLGWFRFSRPGVARLPARFEPVFVDGDERGLARAERRCKSWGRYDRRLKLQVEGGDHGWVGGGGWAGRLSVYARGDFDGDGLEDLMLLRYAKIDGGSASDRSLFIVTQTARRACPRIVRAWPRSLGAGWGS